MPLSTSGYAVADGRGGADTSSSAFVDDEEGRCTSDELQKQQHCGSDIDDDNNVGIGGGPSSSTMIIQRQDSSSFSVDSNYNDPSTNDLNVLQGAALLTADCLGTGLLALPEDVKVLGRWIGLGFLIFNMPVNLYAGTILSDSAAYVERTQAEQNEMVEQMQQQQQQQQHPEAHQQLGEEGGEEEEEEELSETSSKDGLVRRESPLPKKKVGRGNNRRGNKEYSSLGQTDHEELDGDHNHHNQHHQAATTNNNINHKGNIDDDDDNNNNANVVANIVAISSSSSSAAATSTTNKNINPHHQSVHHHHHHHHDTATFDFVGMTQALFSSRRATQCVMALFYTNIFLVLGDYILVMSHAVSALVGEDKLCIHQAGLLASILMYTLSQIRTMANLGRSATMISLASLFIVVVQCLWAVHTNTSDVYVEASSSDYDPNVSLLSRFAALGSIGFAMGSNKLLLNIRHELKERNKAPKVLAMSLSTFVTVYVGIILLAGPDPPGFLFDAISPGWNRRVAGLFLWIHVAVSYSINSQAICASMDRLFFNNIQFLGLNNKPKLRWMCLTGIMSVTAFVVANAVPFFKDLVALIGALTSIPLSLHLPGIFFRKFLQVPICCPTRQTLGSYGLLVFATAFMAAALAGSISSIELDWSSHGGAFACHE